MVTNAKVIYLSILALFVVASNCSAAGNIPSFTAAGIVSRERFNSIDTNAVEHVEGNFLFSYSNNVWQIQLTYKNPVDPALRAPGDMAGSVIDCRRIPDGIREITTFSTNAVTPGIDLKKLHPSAFARSDRFPDMAEQELFLPWLSLCPNPELPVVNSNLIHFIFKPKYFDNAKNEGGFKVSYIEPEKQFLSELIVTNSGTLFLSDGNTLELPDPYKHGYVQFSYQVLELTNCNGISFPFNTVLCQFAPSPTGRTSEDLHTVIISRLTINQIDIGGHQLALMPVPTDLVALDTRPEGLNNGITVNYNVINDQWYALTNKRLEQLANFFRRQPFNKIDHKDTNSIKREVVYGILVAFTLVPLIGLVWINKLNKKK